MYLDVLLCNGQPGWYTIYDAAHAFTVGFSKSGHAEGMSKCISTSTDAKVQLPAAMAQASVYWEGRPQSWLEHLLCRWCSALHKALFASSFYQAAVAAA